MKRWEIYWADVKFEETNGSKIRPIVILNDNVAFVVGLGVTSSSPRPESKDYVIKDWEQAGLDHQSTIRVDRSVRINKDSVFEKIGELSKRDSMILALYNGL